MAMATRRGSVQPGLGEQLHQVCEIVEALLGGQRGLLLLPLRRLGAQIGHQRLHLLVAGAVLEARGQVVPLVSCLVDDGVELAGLALLAAAGN